jgi:hypothetical protein
LGFLGRVYDVNRKRRGLGAIEHHKVFDSDFDLAGGQLGIDVLWGARHDCAAGVDHVFAIELAGVGIGSLLRTEDQLHDPRAIP